MRSLADRLRRDGQMCAPCPPQQFVAHLLAFFEEEEDQHDDEEQSRHELHSRRDVAVAIANRLVRNHADVQRLLFRAGPLGDALQRACEPLEDRQTGRRTSKKTKFLFNALNRSAGRELARDGIELLIDPPTARRKRRPGETDGGGSEIAARRREIVRSRSSSSSSKTATMC